MKIKIVYFLLVHGFLYGEDADGGELVWQWCFWRGSPAARQLEAVNFWSIERVRAKCIEFPELRTVLRMIR